MAWLGLDFGTSSAKALLVTENGTVVGRGSTTYALHAGDGGIREQDPADYLTAAGSVILEATGDGEIVDGVAIVGQNPTEVFLDDAGEPVRPAILWQDTRAEAEAEELGRRFGEPLPLFGTSLTWAATNAPARLLWLARHEPETVRRTARILQPKDHVAAALTDVADSDHWSSKGLCNVVSGQPPAELFDAVGWPASVVPPVRPPWAVRGTVTARAARTFGLPAGIPVAIGWSDALSPFLGLGAFPGPSAVASTGSSDCVGLIAPGAPSDAWPLYGVPSTCAPVPLVYGPTQTSGAAVAWFARLFGIDPGDVAARAAELDTDSMPVFLPYLAGERAPMWRTDVRGAFLGLGLDHGPAELARAILLGVACTTRRIMEAAEAKVGGPAPITFVGGHATAPGRGRTILAAVLGRAITVRTESQVSALGAAMLAAAAASGRSPVDVSREMAGPAETCEPTDREVEAGGRAYERFIAASRLTEEFAASSSTST